MRAFLRCFSIQGSWNYRTMIGAGMAHALSPLLERVHAGDPAALRAALERHASGFNAHPYMSPIAIGALARLELEGEDAETLTRFRSALQAPLGALGDQAVWAGWRPFCTLVAAIAFILGVGPVLAISAFLLVYNIGHIGLRVWGFRCGWRAGIGVGAVLKTMPLKSVARRIVPVNQALMGVLAAMLIGRAPDLGLDPWVAALGLGAGLSGYLLPERVAGPAVAALFMVCLTWLL